jgi:hypothetical protein
MPDEMNQKPRGKPLSALMIALALVVALLPSVLVYAMFAFFKGRNVPTLVLLAECLFSLGCSSAPAILVIRRYPALAVVVAALFIPLNCLIAFFFGCTAVLSAH